MTSSKPIIMETSKPRRPSRVASIDATVPPLTQQPRKPPQEPQPRPQVLRLASLAGLFPSSPSSSSSSSPSSFWPLCLKPRLIFTLVGLLALLVVEAMAIVNVFVLGGDGEEEVKKAAGSTSVSSVMSSSEYAPLVQYGTTVLSILLLLRSSFLFPRQSSSHWSTLEDSINRDKDKKSKSSSVPAILLTIFVVSASVLQSAAGTAAATVIDFTNDTASLHELNHFFSKYISSSHKFVSNLTQDSLVAGVAAFAVANYSVIVWTIIDLTLILVSRHLSTMASNLLHSDNVPENHFRLCKVISGLHLDYLFLTFYLGSLYFLHLHLLSLFFPPLTSVLYVVYHLWAGSRQILRLCLVSFYAVRLYDEVNVRPLRVIVEGRWNEEDESQNIVFDRQEEGWLKDQIQLFPSSFHLGPSFLPLNRRTLLTLLLAFVLVTLVSVHLERQGDREEASGEAMARALLYKASSVEGGGGSVDLAYSNSNNNAAVALVEDFRRRRSGRYFNIVQW